MSDEATPKVGEYESRPNGDAIPCPFLLAAYNHGELNPAPDGTLSTDALEKAVLDTGLSPLLSKTLVWNADRADDIPDSVNLFELHDTVLDHSGSTGVRDPDIDLDKLEELVGFAEDGRMYSKHFAAATSHFRKDDPGFTGTVQESMELTTLVEVYGRPDEDGDRYLTVDDVRGLWAEGRYPEGWQRRPRGSIGPLQMVVSGTQMIAERVGQRLWKLLGRD